MASAKVFHYDRVPGSFLPKDLDQLASDIRNGGVLISELDERFAKFQKRVALESWIICISIPVWLIISSSLLLFFLN